MNPDGSDVQSLIGGGCDPYWSADGARLVLEWADESRFEGDAYIVTSAADGSSRTTVALAGYNPAWSPDGQRVAYDCVVGLCVVNADGTGFRVLVSERCNGHPDWSPDGTRLAFVRVGFGGSNCNGPKGVLTMSPEGGQEQLVEPGDFTSGPNWSPDGRKLVYSESERVSPQQTTLPDLFSIDVDGTGRTRLTETADVSESQAAWSPDGTQIVFVGAPLTSTPQGFRFPPDIHVMKADGTNVRRLTTDGGEAPNWQPIPGPNRADFQNAAQFCKAERAFWGREAFEQRYGGRGNGVGPCVRASR
jgi:TolB protein